MLKPSRNITARPCHTRPVPPIKLARLRLRTFRPDSSSPNACGAIDRIIFVTVPRVDALQRVRRGS
jgi:hypothetical protein